MYFPSSTLLLLALFCIQMSIAVTNFPLDTWITMNAPPSPGTDLFQFDANTPNPLILFELLGPNPSTGFSVILQTNFSESFAIDPAAPPGRLVSIGTDVTGEYAAAAPCPSGILQGVQQFSMFTENSVAQQYSLRITVDEASLANERIVLDTLCCPSLVARRRFFLDVQSTSQPLRIWFRHFNPEIFSQARQISVSLNNCIRFTPDYNFGVDLSTDVSFYEISTSSVPPLQIGRYNIDVSQGVSINTPWYYALAACIGNGCVVDLSSIVPPVDTATGTAGTDTTPTTIIATSDASHGIDNAQQKVGIAGMLLGFLGLYIVYISVYDMDNSCGIE